MLITNLLLNLNTRFLLARPLYEEYSPKMRSTRSSLIIINEKQLIISAIYIQIKGFFTCNKTKMTDNSYYRYQSLFFCPINQSFNRHRFSNRTSLLFLKGRVWQVLCQILQCCYPVFYQSVYCMDPVRRIPAAHLR